MNTVVSQLRYRSFISHHFPSVLSRERHEERSHLLYDVLGEFPAVETFNDVHRDTIFFSFKSVVSIL